MPKTKSNNKLDFFAYKVIPFEQIDEDGIYIYIYIYTESEVI